MKPWQPSSQIQVLKKRAKFMAEIRAFFLQRDVLEVETPILSNGTVTDLHLEAFSTEFAQASSGNIERLYLQTSPEFAMKRLLAAGSGAIFQITKSFRNETAGRFHNPEFSMLEWYRPDYNDHDLMTEIDEFIQKILDVEPAEKLSYQQAFIRYLDIDPLTASSEQLQVLIQTFSNDEWITTEVDKDTQLQWLFSMKIEPKLGANHNSYRPCFVYDFPASQASLARINQRDSRVAHRFELYFKGVELANGFYELQNAQEQISRFEHDNKLRLSAGLATKPLDYNFIAALEHGLPDCAGVALGLDRLFMLQQNLSHIQQAISFDIERA